VGKEREVSTMQRSVLLTAAACCLSATLYAGCVFYSEDCDYIETQCWDVVDVYCDAWGCWENWYTECEDYCVNVAAPIAAPECTADRHCASGFICEGQRCVREPSNRPGAGLCEACDVNADCEERDALCLNLTPDASVGYCGRSCGANRDCPSGFECVGLQGASGSQCVPLSRTCSGTAPQCSDDLDCRAGEVCDLGTCVPECTENRHCAEGQICSTAGRCVDRPAECTDPSDCAEGQDCVQGRCEAVEPVACTDNDECEAPQICLDSVCSDPECADNTDCGSEEECVDGRCELIEVVACQRNVDCGETGLCVDGNCRTVCDSNDVCPGNQVCRAGLCSPPPDPECAVGADCGGEAGDFFCVNGTCRVSCVGDAADCDFGYFCRGFYCDVDPNVECRDDLECGLEEVCLEGECLVDCSASCACPLGLSCDEAGGVCRDLPFPESCEDDCDCPGGFVCTETACVEQAG
jgi:Cys-rich repeat protein